MTRALLLVALLVLAPSTASAQAAKKHCATFSRGHVVSPPLTIKEVEDAEMEKTMAFLKIRDDLPRLPFAFENAKWVAFKSRMREGDKLVQYSSDQQSWKDLAGEAGYAILRSGCIVGTMTTMIN
ncbi:hypothetical protein LQ564_17430 [Massilia sp. G4R7]|uniref:C-type lysozyme inhibitor domain-containing protein n=1 Tax=Massilia phyllostachyos TaxID=2898585 RepID=A0ABS8Q934_9BURK|nr:hypothetical protein [Massilia phyllostachyos]MCD2518094.1 hypothetical protein [Massilia phyllostachyos]